MVGVGEPFDPEHRVPAIRVEVEGPAALVVRRAGDCQRQRRLETAQAAVELIGRRWTGAVLFTLLSGATRFVEIRELVPHLSDKMLSARLKELEEEGIVVRTVFPETPVRIEYHLTDKGRDLERAVAAVSEWADRWLAEPAIGAAPHPQPAAIPS